MNGLKSDTIYPGQVLKVYQSSANYSASERANPNLYWLSRIIYAEASGEPYLGKVAVGNVVLNRVASRYFPNSVKGVIFEYYKGVPQFSPVADGSIYNIPSTQSIKAALEALRGAKPARDALYFFNPRKSSGSWIARNKTYVTRIGNHVFYK
ncbi:MAG TPA: hypothetical protein DD426_11105 [Clostridiaceae bacterium]|nr:hypothetical protein [Clostridiaceae bacterium]